MGRWIVTCAKRIIHFSKQKLIDIWAITATIRALESCDVCNFPAVTLLMDLSIVRLRCFLGKKTTTKTPPPQKTANSMNHNNKEKSLLISYNCLKCWSYTISYAKGRKKKGFHRTAGKFPKGNGFECKLKFRHLKKYLSEKTFPQWSLSHQKFALWMAVYAPVGTIMKQHYGNGQQGKQAFLQGQGELVS